ncbi:PREDICTED: activator of 90 kDa heat shock protein ATPase homolog 1 [Nicrophorus vespilloides]|uniref:Activator of 90 kDa heat shock protein ATPase homolog 1 n=1 Tax=Nicrophorus vespilloides TaxID=110193 RepID=A0ABM1MND0_NICVS|nr:PREDICTED: activator of 90 kDa heat shock protein ATPase homolog 1 [Nicrophorus vespilloides]
MAKWGEGDPRWIVEERPDATNVNNWHWTERNATPWSQEKIKELFKDVAVPSDVATITIDEVDKLEGEASASNRKGKLIFFYEWNLILKWSGVLNNGSGVKYDGKITIPNLSEENDVTDLDIQISVKEMDQDGQILKDIMHKHGKDVVRDRVANYLASLTQEFSKGMILPKKDGIKPDSVKILTSGFNKKIDMQPVVEEKKSVGLKIDTTTLKINLKFQCKAMEFYDAMTRVEMVTAFTRGAVKLEVFKGGKFEMFGGNITGIFDELVPGKKIVQQWRYKPWPVGHHSIVTISIDEKDDHTQVKVVQSGVPTAEAETTRNNWEMYYWQSMKRTFGFGAFIE